MSSSATAPAAALAASFIPSNPILVGTPSRISATALTATSRTPRNSIRVSCQVAVTTDVSSSSSSTADDEESLAASKIGKRIRVKVPLTVYHVSKAPELELNGMEGTIKQYVGVWKGKTISANLPFKVEFFASVEGQEKPVKFFAHLKEDEFDYLEDGGNVEA